MTALYRLARVADVVLGTTPPPTYDTVLGRTPATVTRLR